MYDKKLSIIIPTKNRQQYAHLCIKTLLKFNSEDFEIVVHDNSDDDSLKHMLEDAIDGVKLKYAYDNKCLSFCANFEKSIEMSNGDFLTIIGDDDCVLPEIIELTKVLREKNIDACVFSTESSYMWPNAVSNGPGRLVIRRQRNYIKKKITGSAIKEMIATGDYDYQRYAFPKIYHGVIRREKFDEVREKSGHYFGGLTPDIYSAVALSYYVDSILYIDTSFTLPGTCARSGSADSLTGRHTGELSEAPHFRGHDSYEWDERIPYVYSVDTIWAETAFKAAVENGKTMQMNQKEFWRFLVHIGRRCPMFIVRLAKLYAERYGTDAKKTEIKLTRASKKLGKIAYLKKCWRFGLQFIKGRYVFNDVENIEKAVLIMDKEEKNRRKIIKKVRNLSW